MATGLAGVVPVDATGRAYAEIIGEVRLHDRVSGSLEAVSGLQWHEPIEGLEFGEIFLGTIASISFARGRLYGYGFLFTDKRIIGWRLRRVGLALRTPEVAAAIGPLLISLYGTLSGTGLTEIVALWFPVFFAFALVPVWILARKLSERIVSRRARDLRTVLNHERDFELRRDKIEELLMQSPAKRWNLGSSGYLTITGRDNQVKQITIKLYQWDQAQRLRDLIINFSNREPKVRAMEYPS